MSDGDLADTCAELATWLIRAEQLLPEHDELNQTRTATQPKSAPPWNPSVAVALFDAHQGIRNVEAALRLSVAGTAARRGGSHAATLAALDAITRLGAAATVDEVRQAVRDLTRHVNAIRRLPAVDDLPVWERLPRGEDGFPPKCVYCGSYTLRVSRAAGQIMCILPGCKDGNGDPPHGRLDVGQVSGEPLIEWDDGKIQLAP